MAQTSQFSQAKQIDQATYWNEHGGKKWVQNIDHIDRMIRVFGARLVDAAAPAAGERVLDVGCGGGGTSAELAKRVGASGEVLGIDISKVILDVARTRHAGIENLRFALGDAAGIELPADHFDLLTSRFGVMFFEDPVSAFHNLHRAVKSNGRIAFVCWRALAENPWMAAPAAAAFEILPAPESQDPEAPGPFSLADDKRLVRILHSAGFSAVSIDPVDESLDLGAPDEALQFLTRMGPASAALEEASEEDRQAVFSAIKDLLREHVVDNVVRMHGAIWLVKAAP